MAVDRVSPFDSSLEVTITPPTFSYDEFTITFGPTGGEPSEMSPITVSDVSSPTTITGLDSYTQYTFNVTTLFMEFPSTVESATEYTGTLLMLDMNAISLRTIYPIIHVKSLLIKPHLKNTQTTLECQISDEKALE